MPHPHLTPPLPTDAEPSRLPGDFFGGLRTRAAAWQDAIIDLMLNEPGISNSEIARRIGRSPPWISTIVNSDTFRERFQARRLQFSEAQGATLAKKLSRVAELSLDLTAEVLEKQRDKVPLKMLNELNISALDRLGYGPSRSESVPGVSVNINNSASSAGAVVASGSALAKARQYMLELQSSRAALPSASEVVGTGEVVEGEREDR